MENFIRKLPKAELHVHLGGTLQPDLFLAIAERNNIAVPYKTVQEASAAYTFTDFYSFIQAFDVVIQVLLHEQDFYDVMFAYLKRVVQQGVIHVEVFFDFQCYAARGIEPDTIVNGLHQALTDGAQQFGISGSLIFCFIRTHSLESASKKLDMLIPFKDKVVGIGLAGFEPGYPPLQFASLFQRAHALGFRTVAHVESGNAGDIWDIVEQLGVDRIDHGFNSMQDQKLVEYLKHKQIPLTVCPLSNKMLGFYPQLHQHPLKAMIDAGLMVTINSDDPAFFGGDIADNYQVAYEQMGLTLQDLITCARNSITASFISQELKEHYHKQLNAYINSSTL